MPYDVPDYVWAKMTGPQQALYIQQFNANITPNQRAATAGYATFEDYTAALLNYRASIPPAPAQPQATLTGPTTIVSPTQAFQERFYDYVQAPAIDVAPYVQQIKDLTVQLSESQQAASVYRAAITPDQGRPFSLQGVGEEIGGFFGGVAGGAVSATEKGVASGLQGLILPAALVLGGLYLIKK